MLSKCSRHHMWGTVVMNRSNTSGEHEQGDLFGSAPVLPYRPELDRVRRRIDRILSDLRAQESARDWPYGRVSFVRMVFPKLTCWLPEDEATQLEAQFEAEMVRLEAG